MKNTPDSSNSETMRLDKWLWAARFFKTRSQAADEISGGKVHCNSERCKPAKMIKAGDRLQIRKGIYEFLITVEGLSRQRLSAPAARQLYTETDESLAARQARRDLYQAENPLRVKSPYRPNKRERRQLAALKNRADS